MEKPLSLVIEEFRKDVEQAVSKSKLSPVILEMIFKDFYGNVRDVAIQYSQQEFENYSNAILEEKKTSDDKQE